MGRSRTRWDDYMYRVSTIFFYLSHNLVYLL